MGSDRWDPVTEIEQWTAPELIIADGTGRLLERRTLMVDDGDTGGVSQAIATYRLLQRWVLGDLRSLTGSRSLRSELVISESMVDWQRAIYHFLKEVL